MEDGAGVREREKKSVCVRAFESGTEFTFCCSYIVYSLDRSYILHTYRMYIHTFYCIFPPDLVKRRNLCLYRK